MVDILIEKTNLEKTGHIIIYFFNKDEEDYIEDENHHKINTLKFDFFPGNGESLLLLKEKGLDSIPHLWDDYYISLTSEISFKTIYEKLKNSSFATGNNFDIARKNCVMAAFFALKVAGIKLDTRNRTCASLLNFMQCRHTFTTPHDFMRIVKQYKIAQFKDDRYYDHYEDVKNDILKFSNDSSVINLLNRVDDMQKKYPQHMNHLVDLLQVIDNVLKEPEDSAYKEKLAQLSEQYKRSISPTSFSLGIALCLFGVLAMMWTLGHTIKDLSIPNFIILAIGISLIVESFMIAGNAIYDRICNVESYTTPLSRDILKFKQFAPRHQSVQDNESEPLLDLEGGNKRLSYGT